MVSVTYWNRMEPRPRSADIQRALCAEVRDPLWMLARQWQVGEFQGEDAGSPIWAELTTQSIPVTSWASKVDDVAGDYNLERWPFERVVQAEAYDGTDLLQAASLGAYVEELLRAEVHGLTTDAWNALVSTLRTLFPLHLPLDGDPRRLPQDANAQAFVGICAGRCLDGYELARRVRAWGSNVARVLPEIADRLEAEVHAGLSRVLQRFKEDLPELLGPENPGDSLKPFAWDQETLRYRSELQAHDRDTTFRLAFSPDRDGMADWWNFESHDSVSRLSDGASVTRRVHPGHVRFAGMPNARWWDFESATTDFGAVQVDRRDLARMAIMEFMLVQGNDWFMIPFQMHIGTICQVDSLCIHDVFGEVQEIPSAAALILDDRGRRHRWTMFATSANDDVEKFFHLPPSVSATRLDGPVLEEVQFLRDEMANLGWVIEHTISTQIGDPLEHRNRSPAGEASTGISTVSTTSSSDTPTLAWKLQSQTPACWYPLLPVRADVGSFEIVLRLGREALSPDTEEARNRPVGRILHAEVGDSTPQWREEEIPRAGVRVARRAVRSRWIDGSTHIWTMRTRLTPIDIGTSGLKFDSINL